MEPAENMESFHKTLFISCLLWYDKKNLHYVEFFGAIVLGREVDGLAKTRGARHGDIIVFKEK